MRGSDAEGQVMTYTSSMCGEELPHSLMTGGLVVQQTRAELEGTSGTLNRGQQASLPS